MVCHLNPVKLLEIATKCDSQLNILIEPKLFGGGSLFGDWETEKPSFYFNPED